MPSASAKSLAVVGCGGFGREVVSLVEAINDHSGDPEWNIVGLADDAPSELNLARCASLNVEHVGTVDDLLRFEPTWFVVAIAHAGARRQIALRLEAAGWQAATLAHPSVTMDARTSIGPGSIICAGARLTTGTVVGRHAHLDQNVTVGHDCSIGDFARLNPAACVSGWVEIGAGALIGANATVLQGLGVGAEATVGAGAVVVRDVPPSTTVKGVPAQ